MIPRIGLILLFAAAVFIPAAMSLQTSSNNLSATTDATASLTSPLARGAQPLTSGIPALTDWGIGVLVICLMLASLLSFRRAMLSRRWPDDALNTSGHRPNLDRRLL